MPNGVAFRDGDLYVAEVSRILRFENIEDNLATTAEPVVFDNYPTETITAGVYLLRVPDGKLAYVPVGAPAIFCESEEGFASITAASTRTARAWRSCKEASATPWASPGIPKPANCGFTDSSTTGWNDDEPACEFKPRAQDGMHFGYPYCHRGTTRPEFGDRRSCDEFTPAGTEVGSIMWRH